MLKTSIFGLTSLFVARFSEWQLVAVSRSVLRVEGTPIHVKGRRIYGSIYVYICVCMCVCVCVLPCVCCSVVV